MLSSIMPRVTAAGRSLEYEWVGTERSGRPVLVFLHEGLGSIRQWRDFPQRLAEAFGCRALVYDRYGYGQSEVLQEPRRSVRFMHDEALLSLPEVLACLKVENPVLVGHSDGASISLIHAGAGHKVKAVVRWRRTCSSKRSAFARSSGRRALLKPPICRTSSGATTAT